MRKLIEFNCAICGVKTKKPLIDKVYTKYYELCPACFEKTRGMKPKDKRRLIKQ